MYEEGSPKEVFKNPQKEKTRQFIHRMKMFRRSIVSKVPNFIEINSEISEFGFQHMIDHGMILKMLTVAEELCVTIIYGHYGEKTDMEFSFGYADDIEVLEMVVRYKGSSFNPLENGDPLALIYVRNVVEDLRYHYEEGINTVRGVLKKQR